MASFPVTRMWQCVRDETIIATMTTPEQEPTRADAYRTLAYLCGIEVDRLTGVGAVTKRKLSEQKIDSIADLLLTVPRRYLDRSNMSEIAGAPVGEDVTVRGTVTSFSKRRITRGRTMVEARVSDGSASVRVVWFNPYISLEKGEQVALSGKIDSFKGSLQMKSPAVDRLSDDRDRQTGKILPVYAGIGGMGPARVKQVAASAVARSLPITDVVPDIVLATYGLVDRSQSIRDVHSPDAYDDIAPARRRLIFDEFLRIQMALRVRAHDEFESQVGISNATKGPLMQRFLVSLPYDLTEAQETVLGEILGDMDESTPMHRLLQGEVGSGKTVVMIVALLASVESGHQSAVMAPTEVLATQHYLGTERALCSADLAPAPTDLGAAGTQSFFGDESTADRPVRIGLFTSGRVTVNFVRGDVSRDQGLAWLRDGTIDIAFGTQALIQSDVAFRSLGTTVVDEQHRFGVEQRVVLRDAAEGEGTPDLLLMTATPIPRTLAMTLYGDLDVSVIAELPPGRSPIATEAVPESADDEIDLVVQAAVAENRQVFVVCPLVEPSDKIEARSAVTEFARMRSSLPAIRIELLHGQLKSVDKAQIMARFADGDIDVLVATTVIEVGIDVPNATLMVIRSAERFGLSQLHQLRGRVGRGEHGGLCILATDANGEDGERRIEAMIASNDGFELATVDLEIRGQGTVFAGSQSGAADLKLGDILADHELLEAARSVATVAVNGDRDGSFVAGIIEEAALLFGRDTEWLSRS
ncbi:MAG: ATP-dependent DNA helicase RecG [Acidimicrobiia bacterium]|nr:MAG: ATP-dependent DNA helicase RecG [Acidimicrobiia bacterium]